MSHNLTGKQNLLYAWKAQNKHSRTLEAQQKKAMVGASLRKECRLGEI